MFSSRLKFLRNKKNISQKKLANDIFVSQQTIAKWETDRSTPNPETLSMLADYFGITVDYLLGKASASSDRKKGVKIPVLGRVAAGIPIEAVEDIIDYEEISEDMARTGEFFALQIKGDSMEPIIAEGDVVVVRKQEDCDTGDVAIVFVNGHDATCKKIKKTQDGVMLVPNNPAYEVMFYSNEQVHELPLVIVGKVIELRRKF